MSNSDNLNIIRRILDDWERGDITLNWLTESLLLEIGDLNVNEVMERIASWQDDDPIHYIYYYLQAPEAEGATITAQFRNGERIVRKWFENKGWRPKKRMAQFGL